ncbi:MAG: hypothetical protein D6806_16505 [Deltaproteobacteria bacterium]|nr:MAG: hypothetical protein D6806_16505 [Deltaproteobacteria bacterium]
MNKTSPMTLALLVLLSGCAHTGAAWRINDPAADARGPGSFELPAHHDLRRDELDLRRVELARTNDGWKIEITFASRLHLFEIRPARDEVRRVFLPTVDVYFRTGGEEPVFDALPGRRVRIAGGWQRAVVISPLPELSAEAIRGKRGLRQRVFVAPHAKVAGRSLRTLVPLEFLGERWPEAVAVLVCASAFTSSFRIVDRLRDEWESGGAIMPVLAYPSGDCRLDGDPARACHLTGCKPCGGHPQVVDVLAPEGLQQSWLSDYTVDRPATVEALEIGAPSE